MDNKMIIDILLNGAAMTVGVLYLFYMALKVSIPKAETIAFTSLVLFEMIRVYVIRSNYKLSIFSNKYEFWAVTGSIFAQLLIVYTPFLDNYFKSVPLALNDWISIIIVGFLSIVLFNWIIRKILPNRLLVS